MNIYKVKYYSPGEKDVKFILLIGKNSIAVSHDFRLQTSSEIIDITLVESVDREDADVMLKFLADRAEIVWLQIKGDLK